MLLSHAGYEKNVEIGQKVDGIDLIISGDTHYLLGKEFEQFGLVPEADSYPKKVIHLMEILSTLQKRGIIHIYLVK